MSIPSPSARAPVDAALRRLAEEKKGCGSTWLIQSDVLSYKCVYSVAGSLHGLYVVVVLKSEGVNAGVNSEGLAHCDASRTFRDDATAAPNSLIVRPSKVVIRAAQKVILVLLSIMIWDVLQDLLLIEVVIVVVREFVRFFLSKGCRLLSRGRGRGRRRRI